MYYICMYLYHNVTYNKTEIKQDITYFVQHSQDFIQHSQGSCLRNQTQVLSLSEINYT